jgi:hypothetical protein
MSPGSPKRKQALGWCAGGLGSGEGVHTSGSTSGVDRAAGGVQKGTFARSDRLRNQELQPSRPNRRIASLANNASAASS